MASMQTFYGKLFPRAIKRRCARLGLDAKCRATTHPTRVGRGFHCFVIPGAAREGHFLFGPAAVKESVMHSECAHRPRIPEGRGLAACEIRWEPSAAAPGGAAASLAVRAATVRKRRSGSSSNLRRKK